MPELSGQLSLDEVDDLTRSVFEAMSTERNADSYLAHLIGDFLAPGDGLSKAAGTSQARAALEAVAAWAEERAASAGSLLSVFRILRAVSPRIWASAAAENNHVGLAVRSIAEVLTLAAGELEAIEGPPGRLVSQGDAAVAGIVLAGAEAYSNLAAAHRCVAKGQLCQVESLGPLMFHTPGDQAVSRLIAIRDKRINDFTDDLGTAGFISGSQIEGYDGVLIIGAQATDPAELIDDARTDRPAIRTSLSTGETIWLWERSAQWSFQHGLNGAMARLQPYEPLLQAALGCRIGDMLAVLQGISVEQLEAWELYPGVPRDLDLNGYFFAPHPDAAAFERFRLRANENRLAGADQMTTQTLTNALDALTVRRNRVDPALPFARLPLVECGDWLLVDATATRLSGPLQRIEVPDRARDGFAQSLEAQVHEQLAPLGEQPFPPSRNIQSDTGMTRSDLDASVIIGNVLVAVDCYGSPWSARLDLGDWSPTSSRARNLAQKVRDWDAKWSRFLAEGCNWLSPHGIQFVLPAVVTPGPEWFADDDQELWFTPATPRACTVVELKAVLTGVDTARWQLAVPAQP